MRKWILGLTIAFIFLGVDLFIYNAYAAAHSPAAPAFTVADSSKLQIEIADLAEADAARLALGQSARIQFQAPEGATFAGQVVRITQLASDPRGDKVYRVTIELQDPVEVGVR